MQHNDLYQARLELAKYRLERAKIDLSDAEDSCIRERYFNANNRAYYSIYHAISAVFALDGKAYKRHGTALAAFNKDYISKGVFDKSFGRRIVNASEIRHASDYDDFYIASKDEVVKQIELAKDLISEVERYIDSKK